MNKKLTKAYAKWLFNQTYPAAHRFSYLFGKEKFDDFNFPIPCYAKEWSSAHIVFCINIYSLGNKKFGNFSVLCSMEEVRYEPKNILQTLGW